MNGTLPAAVAGSAHAPAAGRRRALMETGAQGLADQLLFAGTHFLLNVALARWLEPTQYGVFALAYGLFLLADALHEGLVAEPLLVFSQRRVVDRLEDYLGAVFYLFAALALLVATAMVGAALLLGAAGAPDVSGALLALGCAAPFQLLALLTRRLCYARLRPGIAASGGAVYAIVVGALLAALRLSGSLSVPHAVAAMAVGSSSSAAWMGWRLRLVPNLAQDWARIRRVLSTHWSYGRWSMVASAAALAPWNLHYALLAGVLGLAGIAQVRALYNVLLPMRHLTYSLSVSMLPVLSKQLASSQPERARATAGWLALAHAAVSLCYVAAMILAGPTLLLWIYGEAYAPAYPLAGLVAAIQLPVGAMVVVGILMRAANQSKRLLAGTLSYAALSLGMGSAGAVAWGTPGLVGGILGAACLALAVPLAQIRRAPPW